MQPAATSGRARLHLANGARAGLEPTKSPEPTRGHDSHWRLPDSPKRSTAYVDVKMIWCVPGFHGYRRFRFPADFRHC